VESDGMSHEATHNAASSARRLQSGTRDTRPHTETRMKTGNPSQST